MPIIFIGNIPLIVRIVCIFLYPIIGFLSDRDYPFTRTLGRRFPWIMISGLLTPILFVLLFWLPVLDQMIFGLIFFICYLLYTMAFSLYFMNYFALLFTKFRNPKERFLIAIIAELLSAIGTYIVIFFAPFYINFGDVSSYRSLSINIAIFFIIPLLIGILGLREEEDLINTYFSPNRAPKERFFKDFFQRFTIFKNRNFLILLFRWIVISIFNMLFFNTLPYYIYSVLEEPTNFMVFLYILYNFWFMLAIIFSLLLFWFLGHLNIYKVSGFALGIALVFFFFANSILTTLLFMSIIGFIYGLETVSLIPLIGDIFDEHAIISRKRSEGFSYGFLTIFATIGIIIGPFVMSYVLSSTEFIPYSSTQTPSAQMGIRFLLTMIPGISIIIMMIFFTIFYNLKPDKTEAIRMELRELEL